MRSLGLLLAFAFVAIAGPACPALAQAAAEETPDQLMRTLGKPV